MVDKIKFMKDGKVVNSIIMDNDYSFTCVNCGMGINVDGVVEFE